MTNNIDSGNPTASTSTWQLNALTEALGELTLTVDDSLSIGRGSDNDVVLGSKQVSRNHAVLSVLDGQLYVKDLDSSNGTFINEQRIEGNQSSLLQVDDTIGFASFSFLVNAPVAAVENVESLAPVAVEDATANMNTADDSNTEAAVTETTTKADEFEEYIIEHPTIDEPVVKETGIEDMLPATDESVETVTVDTASEAVVESTNETPDTSLPIENATETVEPAPQEPIVKETGIEEVLSAAESIESAPVEDTPELVVEEETLEEPVVAEEVAEQEVVATEPESPVVDESEPLVEQSAVHEEAVHEKVIHEEEVVNEEPVVEPEHDKTTTTELQEEADPDVLRAKQAATAQFSGTANLGQSRDLGTEGNNAANQAVNNPANAGHIEKKPSGGWFIWVFVAILIVGLALWLFNKGVV
ncbi:MULTISPECIES: FHA domain-containing protein [Psychrobacter]|uniref:FHA domain-containing protein n=1 Tax=Psychrobacter fozii TaxID=198480 RepID=A0A2V4UVY2_9GAMM|nr:MULTISPECIES: FHA domain-containing protein [Psychrobacter]MBH0064119.1 FHA domain-containing protein [Psychrobacter sp. SZ93C1]PYE40696.1 FHA domain-containing protein [Psychrobacter fozii]